MDIESLPEDQREEGLALLEAITEEKKEEEDLYKRREELSDKIGLQEKELKTVKETVSSLEARVNTMHHA